MNSKVHQVPPRLESTFNSKFYHGLPRFTKTSNQDLLPSHHGMAALLPSSSTSTGPNSVPSHDTTLAPGHNEGVVTRSQSKRDHPEASQDHINLVHTLADLAAEAQGPIEDPSETPPTRPHATAQEARAYLRTALAADQIRRHVHNWVKGVPRSFQYSPKAMAFPKDVILPHFKALCEHINDELQQYVLETLRSTERQLQARADAQKRDVLIPAATETILKRRVHHRAITIAQRYVQSTVLDQRRREAAATTQAAQQATAAATETDHQSTTAVPSTAASGDTPETPSGSVRGNPAHPPDNPRPPGTSGAPPGAEAATSDTTGTAHHQSTNKDRVDPHRGSRPAGPPSSEEKLDMILAQVSTLATRVLHLEQGNGRGGPSRDPTPATHRQEEHYRGHPTPGWKRSLEHRQRRQQHHRNENLDQGNGWGGPSWDPTPITHHQQDHNRGHRKRQPYNRQRHQQHHGNGNRHGRPRDNGPQQAQLDTQPPRLNHNLEVQRAPGFLITLPDPR